MQPIHDVDAILLLAALLAAKRRPAELVEVMAAIDLIHGAIPSEAKLAESFQRLAVHGLISEADGGFALTPAAQEIMRQPKNADTPKRIFGIKEKLAAYKSKGDCVPILLSAEQLAAAIQAHRAAGTGGPANLLTPKPKAAEEQKKQQPGQWRKFSERRPGQRKKAVWAPKRRV